MILIVKPDTIRKMRGMAVRHLPRSGDPGAHGEIGFALIKRALVGHHRARANKAHVAFDHIEQLRQFVERGLAQQASNAGDTRIDHQFLMRIPFGARLGVGLEVFFQLHIGVAHHGAEFVDFIDAATASKTFLGIDRLAAIQCDGKQDQGHKRHQHNAGDQKGKTYKCDI